MARRLAAGALVLVALGVGGTVVVVRSALDDPRWIGSARAGIETATGLQIRFESAPVVRLFPRPRLLAQGVTISSAGALDLHAAAMESTFALLPFLRGAVRLDRLRLDDVTGSVDADAVLRAYKAAPEDARGPDGESDSALPQRVTVTSGFVQVRSSSPGADGFVSDLHAVVDGLTGGEAAVSGGATWHGEKAEVSARFDSLVRFLRSGPAKGSMRLKSQFLTAAVTGTWPQGWRGSVAGSITAASPDFSTLMRIVGAVPGPLSGLHNVSLAGTVEPSVNGLALSAARVGVNGDSLEGTLGVELADGHPVVVGTLATEQLRLDPLVAALPPLRDATGAWSDSPVHFALGDLHDLDLRVSAGKIRLGAFVAEDAALSALSHDGRVELTLGEARAFGGLLKARLTSSGAANGVVAKVDASWSQLDLAGLAQAAGLPDGEVAGLSSGHATVEGEGPSVASLIRSLEGKGQVSFLQVEAKAPLVGALIRPDGASSGRSTGIGFDLASLDFRIAGGVVDLDKGVVTGPDFKVDVSGTASLSDRSYSLTTRPSDAEDAAAGGPAPPVLRVAGVLGGPIRWLAPAAAGAPPDAGNPGPPP